MKKKQVFSQTTINSQATVNIFAAASFLNDMGADMISPVWPLFVRNILKANMMTLGFIDGLGEAIVSFSQVISGLLSDRLKKRKIFIWIGYLFAGFSRFGYSLVRNWQYLIPFRILDRAGKIRDTPRDAIVADIFTNNNRGKYFGFLEAMDNFGAICGIIFCVLFFGLLGYRRLFLLAAIPSIIASILIFRLLKEKKPFSGSSQSLITKTEKENNFSWKNLSKNFYLFLFLNSLFSLGTFSYSFLLIYAKETGFQILSIPLLYFLFTLVASISSYFFGWFSDKAGRKNILALSYLLWGATCFNIIISQTSGAIISTFIFYGLHRGALKPVQRSFVAELSPFNFRASGLGIFQMTIGLCAFPASFIAGILWDKINIFAPFYLAFGLTILAIMMLTLVKEK